MCNWHRRNFGTLLVVLATGLFGLPNLARAQIIYDTFGPNFTLAQTSTLIFDSADINAPDYTYGITARGFRTPAYATNFTRAIVPFLMDDPAAGIAPVSVSIWSGEGFYDAGPPFGVIASFIGQPLINLPQRTVLQGGAPSQPTVFSYESTTPAMLAPDTFYWLVTQVTRTSIADVRNSWIDSTGDGVQVMSLFWGGYPYGTPYNIQDDKYSATNLGSSSGFEWPMRIDATAVPEPTSLLLVATGTMTAFLFKRRRHPMLP